MAIYPCLQKFIPDFITMAADKLKIAVLSGKGGTGKTLVSVNLAAAAEKSVYVDCDVEEPNGHLFFKPEDLNDKPVSILIPMIDQSLCTGCRSCTEFCKFNALAFVKDKVIVFDEVCHSCGGCVLLCPAGAITEKEKPIGRILEGTSRNVNVFSGMLNTGEVSGVPIIKDLLKKIKEEEQLTLIDCPPGSACVVMESIKDADFCVLVAEPTVFGVHNLNMVYELVRLFQKPFGVVLNKCLDEQNPAEFFCKEKDIPVLGSIPFDAELGTLNSNAEIAVRVSEKYRVLFTELLENVKKEVLV